MIRKRLLANYVAIFVRTFVLFLSPNTPRAEYCRCNTTVNGICNSDPDDDSCILLPPQMGGFQGASVGRKSSTIISNEERGAPPSYKIMETGYSLLADFGGEVPGYGLYSYAIAINDSDQSARFLSAVFNAIPAVEDTPAQRSQTNIFYIPLKNNKLRQFLELSDRAAVKGEPLSAASAYYAKNFYDYKMSRALLDHLCVSPANEIKVVCESDLSRGPYIFTYARPASQVTPVPPPYLFMDLSDVHETAFPEFIAAFRAQVKREDISDRAKIDTLRLKILSIVLTAADWVAPVQKALADIVHSAGGQSEKDKK